MSDPPDVDFRALIDQLERRRADNSQAMWLAPVLVVAAQAFLLQVLADSELDSPARLMVLAAGVLASVAALVTLLRGRAREVQYSEAIAHYSKQVGFPQVRPPCLAGEDPRHWVDRVLKRLADSDRMPAPIFFWAVTLVVFIAADIAAYSAV